MTPAVLAKGFYMNENGVAVEFLDAHSSSRNRPMAVCPSAFFFPRSLHQLTTLAPLHCVSRVVVVEGEEEAEEEAEALYFAESDYRKTKQTVNVSIDPNAASIW